MKSVKPALLVILALLLVGCRPKAQITHYKAPKPAKTEATDRMLGGVILRGEQAWFFKVMGSIAAVSQVGDQFEALLKSVTFSEEKKPVWKLPEGWQQVPSASTLRHATINAPAGEETLEVSVSALPAPPDAGDDYVLRNVNRWRGQLQLRALLPIELKESTEKIQLADGEAILVSILGKRKSDAGSPPFAPFAGGGSPPPETAGPPPRAEDVELIYKAPPEWRPGKASSFRKASFAAGGAGKKGADISIVELAGAAGGPLSNVNRWRGQIGLTNDLSEEQFAEQVKELPVGDLRGQYVVLEGEEQTVLGVMAPTVGRTWFIKLIGAKAVAEQEKQRFEDFVRSIRFEK